jgi:hypothetical protein
MTLDSYVTMIYSRQLLPEEADWIDQEHLQTPAAQALLHGYHPEQHPRWVQRAISEIRLGHRLAFGSFLRLGSRYGSRNEFLGSIVVKRGTYTDEIELKNFVISETLLRRCGESYFREQGNPAAADSFRSAPCTVVLRKAREHLLDHVISFCQHRGFRRIECELPAGVTSDISLLLQRDFVIKEFRENRYRVGDLLYVLKRHLLNDYLGDPVDIANLAQWYVQSELGKAPKWNIEDLYTSGRLLLGTRPEVDTPQGEGDCLVSINCFVDEGTEHSQAGLRDSLSESADVNLIFTRSSTNIQNRLGRSGAGPDITKPTVIKQVTHAALLQRAKIPPVRVPRPEDVGGIVLHITEWEQQLLSARSGLNCSYRVLSGLGRYVCPYRNPPETIRARHVFFCTPAKKPSTSNVCVVACGQVVATEIEDAASESDLGDDQWFRIPVPASKFCLSHNEEQKTFALFVQGLAVLASPLEVDTISESPHNFRSEYLTWAAAEDLLARRSEGKNGDDSAARLAAALATIRAVSEKFGFTAPGPSNAPEIGDQLLTALESLHDELVHANVDRSRKRTSEFSIRTNSDIAALAEHVVTVLRATGSDRVIDYRDKFALWKDVPR